MTETEETETVVRDSGAPLTAAGERVYEVVRDGTRLRALTMRDHDAVNYAKAMGFVYVQPSIAKEQ